MVPGSGKVTGVKTLKISSVAFSKIVTSATDISGELVLALNGTVGGGAVFNANGTCGTVAGIIKQEVLITGNMTSNIGGNVTLRFSAPLDAVTRKCLNSLTFSSVSVGYSNLDLKLTSSNSMFDAFLSPVKDFVVSMLGNGFGKLQLPLSDFISSRLPSISNVLTCPTDPPTPTKGDPVKLNAAVSTSFGFGSWMCLCASYFYLL